MGYKKGPVGHIKASTGNKAVGFMAEGSAAYMSALNAHGNPNTPHILFSNYATTPLIMHD